MDDEIRPCGSEGPTLIILMRARMNYHVSKQPQLLHFPKKTPNDRTEDADFRFNIKIRTMD